MIQYEMTLFDDESVHEKLGVMTKVEILEDDGRNDTTHIAGKLEEYLKFGKKYYFTIQEEGERSLDRYEMMSIDFQGYGTHFTFELRDGEIKGMANSVQKLKTLDLLREGWEPCGVSEVDDAMFRRKLPPEITSLMLKEQNAKVD